MANPLDTHTYDGELDITLLPDLIAIAELTTDRKIERAQDIRTIAATTFNPLAMNYLDGIISSIGTAANKDPTNGLVADDLLCLCWIYRENSFFMMELETQLLDMGTGFCPQGRTHRLFQTLMAFS